TTFLLERPSSPLYHNEDSIDHFQQNSPPTFRSLSERHFGSGVNEGGSDQYEQQSSVQPTATTFHRVLRQAFKSRSADGGSINTAATGVAAGADHFADGAGSAPTCTAPDARTGLCYEASECSERGGIPMGRCAGGGAGSVCCLF